MTATQNVTLHQLPSADDYAAAARRRALRLGVGGLLLALGVAVTFVGLGKDTPLLPLALLLVVAMPVLLWRFPRACFYTLLLAACVFETGPSEFADALTDRVPFFWNVNTIFQTYAHQDVKAVPLNVLEVFVLTAGVCSVLRAVFSRSVNLRAGALAAPIVLYLGFVALGWGLGMATGGDFKLSLQEVRSQFYFGLAYFVAVNSLRDKSQIGTLLKIFVAGVGLKGILYTFRRYVTLHGLPIPDQGVGAHEEAFFFDAFVALLAVLILCRAYPRLRTAMWCLLPFVELANLACNRRAATAALVVIVPVLVASSLRALPERRKLVAVVTCTLAVLFCGYFFTFRHSGSLVAQPARALQSQIEPDERDASSNAYRDAENADLMATIKIAPLGYGYGKHMLHAVPIADISQEYAWWDVMTHNQILWVWMRVGALGFVAFWLMVSAILIRGGLTLRAPDADGETKVVAMFAMLVIAMLMIFGLLDLQLSNFRDMLFAGFWAGALAFVGLPAAVRMERAGASAPLSRFYAYGARTRQRFVPPAPSVRLSDTRDADAQSKPPPPVSSAPRVARNIATTLLTQLLSWGLTFIVTLYLPRYVGDVGLGALTLAGSFAAVWGLLVGLGTSTVLVKEVARDHARAGELLLAALMLRVPLGLAAVGLGWGAALLLGYNPHLCLLIVVALGGMCIAQLGDVLGCVLRGLELIPRQNATALAERVVTAALTVALVIAHAPLWMIVGVAAVGSVVSLTLAAWALRAYIPRLYLPSWATVRVSVTAGMPFLTTAIFMAIYGQSDAVLLSKMSTVAAIGWYGLAKRLGGTTMVIPVALCGAMLPTLSRLWHADRAAFDSAVRRLWNLMLIAVVPFAAVLVLAPGRVLALLHYPASFAHSVPVLVLMGGAVVLWFLSQVAGTALIASDRQASLSKSAGVAALLSLPLCAGGIWAAQQGMHNGAVGAMLSDVLVEAFLLTAYVRALPPGLLTIGSAAVLGRALVAALPLVALFSLVHSHWGLLWLVPGLALYAPLCFVLGCISPQDVQSVRHLFLKRRSA